MYPTAINSFEKVSGHQKRITYEQFKQWCETKQALIGFNLTEVLLLKLFSDLDPHKKGHLTELDWINAFGSYSWKNQMLNELQSTVASSFSCPREAFNFFIKNSKTMKRKTIQFDGFKVSLESLLPGRYNSQMINYFWKKSVDNQKSLNFNNFCLVFDCQPYTAVGTSRSRRSSNQSSRLSGRTFLSSRTQLSQGKWDMGVIDKVRKTLRSATNKKQLFRRIDSRG